MRADTRVHFIGIGGAGMSAIAVVMLEKGLRVSGSDLKESRNTRRLRDMGADIFIGHRPENVEGADISVVSSAIPERNRELKRARELGMEVLPRAEMLSRLMTDGRGIAVAGTHGKTTTTSMVAMILRRAGLDPTYIVGGELNDVGSNAFAGKGEYVVAEADESDGSFLLLRPWAEVITNVEEDHHDFFASGEEMREYYGRFKDLPPREGLVVLAGDDPGMRFLIGRGDAREITYGEDEGCDFSYRGERYFRGGSVFELLREGAKLGEVSLNIPGRHNVRNAAAALALACSLGVEFEAASTALREFKGVMRRYQFVGEVSGVRFIDDYAHHPTEVEATLKAAELEGAERMVCMFQPHRYSRTAALWREFGKALLGADLVILTDVYAAGEDPLPGINGKLIVNSLLESDPAKQVLYIPKRALLGKAAADFVRSGDLVLTMGAGDISQCADEIADMLRRKEGGPWESGEAV